MPTAASAPVTLPSREASEADGAAPIDPVSERQALENLVREAGVSSVGPANSRKYATKLSDAGLTKALLRSAARSPLLGKTYLLAVLKEAGVTPMSDRVRIMQHLIRNLTLSGEVPRDESTGSN